MITGRQTGQTFERDLAERDDNDDGEHQHTNGLETPAPDGIGVLVLARDQLRGRPYDCCAKEVKSGVYQGCQHGKRACEDDDGDFPAEEKRVRK